MPLSTEVRNQIAAGQCQQGSCETCCLLSDGSEASCYTIRECAPSQHLEYALPGATPNRNIWVLGDGALVWNGPSPAPATRPSVVADPFNPGGVMFNWNAAEIFNVGLPPVQVGAPPRGQFVIPPANAAQAATQGGVGGPVAMSFAPGLRGSLEQYAMATKGSLDMTQAEFCRAYTLKTGFPCDFAQADNAVRPVADWLSRLQSDQDARVGQIGGVFRGNGGVLGSMPAGNRPAIVRPPVQSGNGSSQMMMFAMVAVIAVGAIVILKG